jgi:hypothetical protein
MRDTERDKNVHAVRMAILDPQVMSTNSKSTRTAVEKCNVI